MLRYENLAYWTWPVMCEPNPAGWRWAGDGEGLGGGAVLDSGERAAATIKFKVQTTVAQDHFAGLLAVFEATPGRAEGQRAPTHR